ncbi:hypothetical protein TREMEDRAFT_61524 [Tremella mesenterica DSM 1558]|uniref:uncharacterized protein n=1 Tax=Tremella mesenterica (strain ATCC 24925 / CBS 8224 / DSM 1558 / NBRC 9311 / NRRL Y-6157 / RJB 2259-6 / UBC 559-6) TaxID=578456 RepID=UPI0003F49B1D|nr:uncharacterized protein TREMEDRAFT_61524 [Tremella mesenterica DSM 1558]EIW69760.1 hypothetical protein TREMEDRAFT_61524 [Tremella mesenterica DSM 1558]
MNTITDERGGTEYTYGNSRTSREGQVDVWLSNNGFDSHLKAKRADFIKTLSEAVTVVQDDDWCPDVTSSPEHAKIIKYSRENLIETLRDYIAGRGDKVFHRPSHTACSIWDGQTGCAAKERTIGDLTKSVGDFAMTITPLIAFATSSPFEQASENPCKSEEDEDRWNHLVNAMLQSLTKASLILFSAKDMIHTTPHNVLSKSANLTSGMTLHNGSWNTKDVDQLKTFLEGTIMKHKPAYILTAASNEVARQEDLAKQEEVVHFPWNPDDGKFCGKDTLTSLRIESHNNQLQIVKMASTRLQLAHWGVKSVIRETPMWDSSDVFCIRELAQETCERLISAAPTSKP